jgi:hypothetical protein
MDLRHRGLSDPQSKLCLSALPKAWFSVALERGSAGRRAAGTVFLKRLPTEATPLAFATWQLIIGGGLFAAGMLLFEGVTFATGEVQRCLKHLGAKS